MDNCLPIFNYLHRIIPFWYDSQIGISNKMPFKKDCEKQVIEPPNFKCKRIKFNTCIPIISTLYQNGIILPTWTASCWSDAKLCCIDHRGHTKTTWTILWSLVATYLGTLIYIFKHKRGQNWMPTNINY